MLKTNNIELKNRVYLINKFSNYCIINLIELNFWL